MGLAGIVVYLRKKRSAADIVRQRLQRPTFGRKPTTSELAAGRRFQAMCRACGEWFYFAEGVALTHHGRPLVNVMALDSEPKAKHQRIKPSVERSRGTPIWRFRGMCSACGEWFYFAEGAAPTHHGRPLVNVRALDSDHFAPPPPPPPPPGGDGAQRGRQDGRSGARQKPNEKAQEKTKEKARTKPPPPKLEPWMTKERAREILEVGPNATSGEIHSAYLKLMKRVHPDHGGSI